MYDRLLTVAQARSSAVVVCSEVGDIEDTYDAVECSDSPTRTAAAIGS
jgi:hypothetical protein